MGDTFKRVAPGDKLRIPAAVYNAMLDTMHAVRGGQMTLSAGAGGGTLRPAGVILVKNCTGDPCQRFDVLGLDDPIFLPDENETFFKNHVAFDGVVPQLPEHAGRFVILLEPLKADSIGQGCLAGVCPAWIQLPEDYDPDQGSLDYADVAADDTEALRADVTGGAQILWRDPALGPGESGWAVVRLGTPPSPVLPVRVKFNTGGQGSTSSMATWTYDLYDVSDPQLLGDPLARDVPPLCSRARWANGTVTPAPDGSIALALRAGGQLQLWDCQESRPTFTCEDEP